VNEQPEPQLVKLTPEMWERIQRMALVEGVSPDRIVSDAVGVAWVRFACRNGMKQGTW
jgi:hypothetical protein